MRRHGERRVDPERDRGQHRRADDRAVDEVVKRVADDDERRRRGVHLALVGVAVPQQHELFEDEEHEDAGEQRAEDRRRRHQRQRLGQQREQRDAEQRARPRS